MGLSGNVSRCLAFGGGRETPPVCSRPPPAPGEGRWPLLPPGRPCGHSSPTALTLGVTSLDGVHGQGLGPRAGTGSGTSVCVSLLLKNRTKPPLGCVCAVFHVVLPSSVLFLSVKAAAPGPALPAVSLRTPLMRAWASWFRPDLDTVFPNSVPLCSFRWWPHRVPLSPDIPRAWNGMTMWFSKVLLGSFLLELSCPLCFIYKNETVGTEAQRPSAAPPPQFTVHVYTRFFILRIVHLDPSSCVCCPLSQSALRSAASDSCHGYCWS